MPQTIQLSTHDFDPNSLKRALESKGYAEVERLIKNDAGVLKTRIEVQKDNIAIHHTPLTFAIAMNDSDMVKLLLANNANASHQAVVHINYKIKRNIEGQTYEVYEYKIIHRTPLTLAIKKGNSEIIDLLIENDADINQALMCAIVNNDFDIIEQLRTKGADIHEVLSDAIKIGRDDIIAKILSMLIKDGIDMRKLLSKAIEIGCDDIIAQILSMFIKGGADIHEVLSDAIKLGRGNVITKIVVGLIEGGAKVVDKSGFNINPLLKRTPLPSVLFEGEYRLLYKESTLLKLTNGNLELIKNGEKMSLEQDITASSHQSTLQTTGSVFADSANVNQVIGVLSGTEEQLSAGAAPLSYDIAASALSLAEENECGESGASARPIGEVSLEQDISSHSYLARLQTALHNTAIAFKGIDFIVDIAEAYQIPTVSNIKDVFIGYIYLDSMYTGHTGGFFSLVSSLSVAYTYYEEGLYPAFQQASNIAALAMFSSEVVKINPYIAIAYSVTLSAYTLYNAYSKSYELYHLSNTLEGQIASRSAYKDLFELLHKTPAREFFKEKAIENDLELSKLEQKQAEISCISVRGVENCLVIGEHGDNDEVQEMI